MDFGPVGRAAQETASQAQALGGDDHVFRHQGRILDAKE